MHYRALPNPTTRLQHPIIYAYIATHYRVLPDITGRIYMKDVVGRYFHKIEQKWFVLGNEAATLGNFSRFLS